MTDLHAIVDRMIGIDAEGRLRGGGPVFHVFRTADRAVCRCHRRLDAAVVAELERLAARERGRPSAWATQYADYLRVLSAAAPLEAVRAGPLYRVRARAERGGDVVRITPDNAGLLTGDLEEWLADVDNGALMFAAIDGDRAASVCASVNWFAEAHVAGVETASTSRGKGLASRAVAAWAAAVLDLGATPIYGTTFDNLASQGVARRLGMELAGSEFSVTLSFDDAGLPAS